MPGGPLRALFALGERMRGYHDEMGGPDSIAQPSEWGPLGWGDGMTAAGLPASPGVAPSALPSEVQRFEDHGDSLTVHVTHTQSPSEETLRHNFLLRRQLTDPGYGASRELSWREKVSNGLGVPYVNPAFEPVATKWARSKGIPYRASPSE